MDAPMPWNKAFAVYLDRRFLIILLLELSALVPYALIFSTTENWFGDSPVLASFIPGQLAFVFTSALTLAVVFRIAWGPIVDCVSLPVLTRKLGRRRAWILFAQFVNLTVLAVFVAATQQSVDQLLGAAAAMAVVSAALLQSVLDAYRIECAAPRRQGSLGAAQSLASRLVSILLAFSLYQATDGTLGPAALIVLGAIVAVAMGVALLAKEPAVNRDFTAHTVFGTPRVSRFMSGDTNLSYPGRAIAGWLMGALICPFSDFFRRHGTQAVPILLLLVCFAAAALDVTHVYRDYLSYLITAGAPADVLESVAKFADDARRIETFYGPLMTAVGAVMGGVIVYRQGVLQGISAALLVLLASIALQPLLFLTGPAAGPMAVVTSAGKLADGLSGVALIAYGSSLVSSRFAATQYAALALLSLPAGILDRGLPRLIRLVSDIAWAAAVADYVLTILAAVAALLLAARLASGGPAAQDAAASRVPTR